MTELNDLILEILKEIEKKENILNIRGGRGAGPGTATVNNPQPVSHYLGHEKNETPNEEYFLEPVEISKVFKKGKDNVK